ncbi:unnamed protein product [Rotaria sp. Silwood2]|nr:unnamed protein product [Rotaria sp. Silwood2]
MEQAKNDDDVFITNYILHINSIAPPIVMYEWKHSRAGKFTSVSSISYTSLGTVLARIHSIDYSEFLYLPPFPFGMAQMLPLFYEELHTLSKSLQQHSFIAVLEMELQRICQSLYKKAPYEKLLTSYEDWPKDIITEQTLDESVFLIRGNDRGRPAWHYILVPIYKCADLNANPAGSNIDVTNFGSFIKYRNNRDEIKQMSGWGTDPPNIIQKWIDTHYSTAAVDESINLTYTNDDIRLCTMQRAIPEQKIGVSLHYFASQLFHYIKLTENLPSSLAHRAGLKSYDRIIYFNGVNIENDTYEQFDLLFETARHLPVQMLVCSPATYRHYKTNKKRFHLDLPTIQHLKPVYATSTSDSHTYVPAVSVDNASFCAVRWENNNIVSTVSQLAVFQSPEFTHVKDICYIEIKGQYRKGQIIAKAILAACPNLQHLQVRVLYNDNNDILTSSSLLNHPLRRLILWSDYADLTLDVIDNILTYTPNVEYFYLQTIYSMSLIDLFHGLVKRLHYLSRFDCYITEMLTKKDRINNLTDLHQIHRCFNRIHSIEENDKFRILATK